MTPTSGARRGSERPDGVGEPAGSAGLGSVAGSNGPGGPGPEQDGPTGSGGPEQDGSAGSGGPEPVTERAREGLEHLQAAARELIAAARAALDVAEDIVDDPSLVKQLTESRSSTPSGASGTATWLEGVASLAGALGGVGGVGELLKAATSSRHPGTAGSRNGAGHAAGPNGDGVRDANGDGDGGPTVERIIIR